MKKRTIAILLAMLMVLSEASMCVFALETEPQEVDKSEFELIQEEAASEEAVTEEALSEEAESSEAKAATGETEEEAEPVVPAVPTGLQTFSACNSVALEWNPVANATGYKVYMNGSYVATVPTSSRAYDNSSKMAYVCKVPGDSTYTFQVSAVNGSTESGRVTASDGPVKQMYIRFTMKKTRKLKSHDGKKKTMKIPKGKTFKAIGYGMGKYHFYYNGYLFYVNYMSVKNVKALYTTKTNYTGKEAEYFVNTSGQTSMTNKLIWVNLYTQHLYIFAGQKGTTGNWRLTSVSYKGKNYSNWEVASGKASTPTPWGLTLKYRGKPTNIYSRSRTGGAGAFWWNKFHSATALHGRAGSGKYGRPASHGCIRNTDDRAKAIYYKIPKKSRVIVF